MNLNYPKPTKSIEVAKNDLKKWGYCLLINAIPPDLNNSAMERLIEQANAEKELKDLQKQFDSKEIDIEKLKMKIVLCLLLRGARIPACGLLLKV